MKKPTVRLPADERLANARRRAFELAALLEDLAEVSSAFDGALSSTDTFDTVAIEVSPSTSEEARWAISIMRTGIKAATKCIDELEHVLIVPALTPKQ